MNAALLCLVGLAALVGGAELLVRGGSRLAAGLGISPTIIGLTIIAIGTSTPELAVGIEAAIKGMGSLAAGNIAGTNTFNILFILGLGALMAPLSIERHTLRIDLPAMIASAAALMVVAADAVLTRIEGLVLVAGGIGYTAIVVWSARQQEETPSRIRPENVKSLFSRSNAGHLAGLVAGIGIIVVGAGWLVSGASELTRLLGASEALIGLTVVAIGTSSPELVTTIVSTLRGERQIAIGNLIGSSSYNILIILGLTMLVPERGFGIDAAIVRLDIPIMAAAICACLPVFLSGRRMSRLEGGLFVAAYLVYFGYLILLRG